MVVRSRQDNGSSSVARFYSVGIWATVLKP
jgi:hypothetical protein